MTTQNTSVAEGGDQITTKKITPVAERVLRNRVSFREAIKHTMAMAYSTLLLIRRTPQQMFDVTVQPIIFTLLFTFYSGARSPAAGRITSDNHTGYPGPDGDNGVHGHRHPTPRGYG